MMRQKTSAGLRWGFSALALVAASRIAPACSSDREFGEPVSGGVGGQGGSRAAMGGAGGDAGSSAERGGAGGEGAQAGDDGSAGAGGSGGGSPTDGGTGGASPSEAGAGGAGSEAGGAGGGGAGGVDSETGGATAGGAATGGGASGGAGAAVAGAGAGGMPTWCETQSRPAGVAVADYQCLDFDRGLPEKATWPQTIKNAGTFALATDRASSPANSVKVTVPTASDFASAATAIVTWQDVGAAALTSASITADLSPVSVAGVTTPWTGSVTLMCVSFGSGDACLSYTRGADTAFKAGYTGYYIEATYTGGAAMRDECEVTGTLTANLWKRVELRVTKSASPSIQVLFAGTVAGTCNMGFDADSVATFTFGEAAHAATTLPWSMYYDNVVAVVKR